MIARAHGDYGATMEHFMTSLQLAEAAGDERGCLRVLVNIGLLHSKLGDQQRALDTQLDVLARAHALKLPVLASSAAVNVIVAHHELGHDAVALALIDQHLPVVRQHDLQQHFVLLLTYRARCLLALNDLESAHHEANAILNRARKQGDQDTLTLLHHTLGRASHLLGRPDEGRTHLQLALAISRDAGLRPREVQALEALSAFEAAQGAWAAAYHHSRAQQQLEGELRAEAVDHKVQVLTAQMQLEHLQREAALNRARTAELERHVALRTLELQNANEQLRYAAHHDALTGLGNRALFQQHLQQALRGRDGYAVLFLDCDRFKSINDALGHDVGDQVLQAFARRLQFVARDARVIARFGGDEFALLTDHHGPPGTALDHARALSGALTAPLQVAGRTFLVTASVGVVVGHATYDTPETVLRDADIAMYHAKARGPGNVALFDTTMYDRIVRRAHIETELRGALRSNALHVHYQPIVDVRSGQVRSLEALARWTHSQLSPVPPEEFIPIAEDVGLIIDVDRYVMRAACTQLQAWSDADPAARAVTLNVNVSPVQFTHPDFAHVVQDLLTATQVDPPRLHLEITETLLMDRSAVVQANLNALRQLGVPLHIDDFGTGYSSLGSLQALTASTVKIDRSFTRGLPHVPRSAEMVRTIIALARTLHMTVVAEGVDAHAQWTWLTQEGCDLAQGYLFSPPVPPSQVPALLRTRLGTL